MRAGGCTVQQALTPEAANVVKQAVALARRRGHAQVTPLHVANTMLSSSTGLLRTACIQSHSHPLQCRALELCFNVALNRLPASTSSPMLGGHHHSQYPSISNALVAAFKRAQAHQRRGSIENQQQPLLAVKIELEQLIVSILDDPSVSRVMREAGFSSTQVKSNVEQAVSLEICSHRGSPNSVSTNTNKSKESNVLSLSHESPSLVQSEGAKVTNNPKALDPIIRKEDVTSVIENMLNKKRRSFVIVGECLASLEGAVKEVMDKVDKGDVPEALREVKFITLSFASFGHRNREEFEQKLEELKNLVRSCISKGVVLYLGDLKWATDQYGTTTSNDQQLQGRGYYCSIEHMIMEIGKLVCGFGDSNNNNNGRFWLMGIATFQTYMKCKSGNPSIETVFCLHPLTIPADSLRFTLVTSDSDLQSQSTSKRVENGSASWIHFESEERQLTCCGTCSANFEAQVRSLQSTTCNSDSTNSSQLPAWLQQYKNENKGPATNHEDSSPVRDLCKKWNSICNSMHKQQPNSSSERTLTFSSIISPSSSNSGFSHDHQYTNLQHSRHENWPLVEPRSQTWRPDHHFWISETVQRSTTTVDEPRLRLDIPGHKHPSNDQPFTSNPNSTPHSASSSDVIMEMNDYVHKFKEINADNLKTLCRALEDEVPWQKDIIPDIASTLLQCRSRMKKRKETVNNVEAIKEETWLFFQGVDVEAKEKIAKELARLVFGSPNNFISISLSSFSSTRADSTEDSSKNKRSRDEQSCSYIERFAEAVSSNPHRVFFVEDVEQADYCSQMGFKRAIEKGKVINSKGKEVGLSDAIIILSCESFSSRSRACSPPIRQKYSSSDGCEDNKKGGGALMEDTSPCVSLDLNISIDDDSVEDQSIDDIGLLESVDKRIVFKIQEL